MIRFTALDLIKRRQGIVAISHPHSMEETMMKTNVFNIILMASFVTGCLSPIANEGLKRAQDEEEPLYISQLDLLASKISPVMITWYNTSPKTIRRVAFFISTFNQEGEKIFETELANGGPHLPMNEKKKKEAPYNRIWWLGDWYHITMTCILIDKIEINYWEKTVTIDSREQLNQLIADDVVKDCQVKEKKPESS